jgi:hypothetical protein
MIIMFMRYEEGFHPAQRQTQAAHPPLRFTAGKSGVDEHGFFFITDVITIAVTAGVERCNIECHA